MTSRDNLPIIGITGPKGANYQEKLNFIAEKIRYAGGIPQIISWETPIDPCTIGQFIDGWVIAGGADVPAEVYGETRRADRLYVLTARFNFEKELYKIFNNSYPQKPILGICYGMQALNVFAGGKLGFVDQQVHHNNHDNDTINEFMVNKDSLLNKIMINAGDNSLSLHGKCNHGQCLTTLGTDFTISSYHDNIIGSIEKNVNGRWIVGTQWHPERTEGNEGTNIQIFKDLINKAKVTC